ncbi:MAG TPA: S53 family peptidase [Bryobacteraceae bacterium]|jgi:kumamolisin|nr:S53 family peptidase [Bryobacteraceae bacterium]
MPAENRLIIPGSEKKPIANSQFTAPIPADETVTATIILRRRGDHPLIAVDPSATAPHVREEYGVTHGADPKDMQAIEDFAHEHNLTVSERDPARRVIKVNGTAEAIQSAFGTQLQENKTSGGTFRTRSGALSVPASVHPAIVAVLGLDNRPIAKPHFRRGKQPAAPAANPPGTFTPVQLARVYNFPSGVTGAGQTIAIVELGGGYRTADLKAYFSSLQIKEPRISAVSVDAGVNKPGGDADGEVMLDIEVAGAIAPGATIAVYFAPNTDQGFHDAISMAAHDKVRKPSIISISWGGPEDSWTAQARDAMNAALQDAAAMGVTVTVAAGDDGSTDGVSDGKQHVDFPAASPFALACGGTKLTDSGTKIPTEQVWNELAKNEGSTGGGVSNFFPIPDYQQTAGVPKNLDTGFAGRGVPDVCGDADPETGYVVRVDGKTQVIGGTSAVAPLWAALAALLNQQLGHPIGFVNPKLYALPGASFFDVVSGSNGAYKAGPKWDACTGLGSPNGVAIGQALAGASANAAGAPIS